MHLWPSKKKKDVIDEKYVPGANVEADLAHLLTAARDNLRSVDEDLITRAFHWSVDAHKNKVRLSGHQYYVHPLNVALVVIREIPLDDISVACALLHDTIDYVEHFNLKSLSLEFGSTIAEIVEGIHKIKHIEEQKIDELENYRKFLLAMFKDVRIILVKLADRVDNMRTLEYLPLDRQLRIAHETMEIYAPFAHRFGLGSLRWELEDLAFKFINRKAYNDIKLELNQSRKEREDYLENFSKPLIDRLKDNEFIKNNNIEFEISGRPKHIYSIFNKTILRDKPMDELFDLFAIRIIIENESSGYCSYFYEELVDLYKPVAGTFKDYISMPKKNGYQSIHIAVIGPGGRPVEVQIRTRNMHEVSERGVAAHFKYKRGLLPAQSVIEDESLDQWMDLVRSIFENIGDEPVEKLLEDVRHNLFQDEIFVFTPSNEFRTLPKEATPLDFAYSIHTDMGNHFIGAKIAGKVVPLDYKLQSGDQIEILTSKNQQPSKEWLKFVITQRAKSALQKYFNTENRQLQSDGKLMWDNVLKENSIHVSNNELDNVCRLLDLKNRDAFYVALAAGDIDINFVLKVIGRQNNDGSLAAIEENHWLETGPADYAPQSAAVFHNAYFKADTGGGSLPLVFAQCCYPLPGDKITGIMHAGREISIHRSTCSAIRNEVMTGGQTVYEMDWNLLPQRHHQARLNISAEENPALINEITSLLLHMPEIAIKSFNFDTSTSKYSGYVVLEVANAEALSMVMFRLKAIEGVRNLERYIE